MSIYYNASVVDGSGLYTQYYNGIISNFLYAGQIWNQYIFGNASLEVSINISATDVGTANGASATSVFVGNVNGINTFQQGALGEILSAVDPNGSAYDIVINIDPRYLTQELWFDPNTSDGIRNVPTDKTDAVSVFLHELGHALGFNGWANPNSGRIPSDYQSTFDKMLKQIDGYAYFIGENSVKAYGGPVPITFGNANHLGNQNGPGSDLAFSDLMGGVYFQRGHAYDISDVDLGIMKDIGAPVNLGITTSTMMYNADSLFGDGKADILWQNDNGSFVTWTSLGAEFHYEAVQSVYSSWHVKDTGDFNGDGWADILWQNDNGNITTWTVANIDGTVNYNAVQKVDVSWHAQQVADLDGNDRADIIWRNDDGRVTTWTTNSDGTTNYGSVQNVELSWQVRETGDFNGDGRADILWQNTNGSITTWTSRADGTYYYGPVRPTDTNWQAQKTGDFNGDGRDDILWRNTDGSVTTWLSKADGTVEYGAVFKVGTDWHIQATGDYNGDGRDDVLWRNDNGTVVIWDSTGNAGNNAFASHEVAKVGTDWHIVA